MCVTAAISYGKQPISFNWLGLRLNIRSHAISPCDKLWSVWKTVNNVRKTSTTFDRPQRPNTCVLLQRYRIGKQPISFNWLGLRFNIRSHVILPRDILQSYWKIVTIEHHRGVARYFTIAGLRWYWNGFQCTICPNDSTGHSKQTIKFHVIRLLNGESTRVPLRKGADQTVPHSWRCHQMETSSALLALCAGNSPVTVKSPHKGSWRGDLMFSWIFAWINGWVNNR